MAGMSRFCVRSLHLNSNRLRQCGFNLSVAILRNCGILPHPERCEIGVPPSPSGESWGRDVDAGDKPSSNEQGGFVGATLESPDSPPA